jgi:hypothetical protein
MLTGTLPLPRASDGWVLHIARQPISPADRLVDLHPPVSAIIMRLLAKTAEERYQTAAGVERDLRRCLTQWNAERRIDDFPLREQDTPDRLLIPERLYGREREIEILLAAFDRIVTTGTRSYGSPYPSRTSVVNEPLARWRLRALFASRQPDQSAGSHATSQFSEPRPAPAREERRRDGCPARGLVRVTPTAVDTDLVLN